ncbi:hypothetical protein A2313_00525 [Candidatus Roizmanbacteria bacterium RIFOXYB2_FULL_41_10]|uniref:N-acetyltransferase domain-containing protein n=1 Tax=Candidatus Roizmanbacteria bacterium RIFOXYA1_FULL_41_12 TaxID=1802082 RepID=A0A1F7KAJ9_9BACT|nr:MAG: hypothetical protein A2209_04195 [Candidatus Roizmanbacteria bacterium RIFOXYA1_FULL_41_12]OGK66866.1 MAG: hypothetical protein A2377_03130 [Candidatus Roizmanbacteria bacterium RIFOXYB1_FULL_41_27]OGK70760.1 MAG: hypothetical protein A2403_01575 [Candidatus Roizmanbacteria bacterium RIFOXYC1_FULL_41_16]OGK71448.1 MAG: hypothetical protein A2313_00525 [Candidatus Roizmanbacteria bacterium RIFOXYB2_FULL_41_10]OGK75660.1 MAG: hypothetical protein A2575_03120 [Candidatus Roizmanbacteria ba
MPKMTEYNLRSAVLSDAAPLTELVAAAIPGYPFVGVYDSEQVAQSIRNGEYRILAEMPEIGVVATAVLGTESVMSEIKRVVVHPKMRKNGLASQMTIRLAGEAKQLGHIPWADVRADQIGMQRAALAAGLSPVCLEPGKHVVYDHLYLNFGSKRPARETMIHMTSLPVDLDKLASHLKAWPITLRNRLLTELYSSLKPQRYQEMVAEKALPSAIEVNHRISQRINQEVKNLIKEESADFCQIKFQGHQLLIIKPDASGFFTINHDLNFPELIKIAKRVGLQIITCYVDTKQINLLDSLDTAGFIPAMIRPWQEEGSEPVWQVGWQYRLNDYGSCQHQVFLDPNVENMLLNQFSLLQLSVEN